MTPSPIIGRVEKLYVDCRPDDKTGSARDEIQCILTGIVEDKHEGAIRDSSGVREREIFERPKKPERAQVINWRQWSAVSVEEMRLLAHKYGLPETDAVAFDLGRLVGANLIVSGIPHFTALPPTSLLVFPECSWITIAENLPCKGAGEQVEKVYSQAEAKFFAKLALGIRGLVGMVFEGGKVRVGDMIEVRRRGIELRQASIIE